VSSLKGWLDYDEPSTTRVAIIGYGAIGSVVANAILSGKAGSGCSLAAVLTKSERFETPFPDDVVFTHDPEFFFESDWDVCVEAAGQESVRLYAKRCLRDGRDVIMTSIGALTDGKLHAELEKTADLNHAQLMLCSGALPGSDWLGAAGLARVDACEITQTKPPKAWLGTPAEENFDLLELSEATVLYEGSAREAASLYPQNANIACMLALTASTLDSTTVQLVADPLSDSNQVQVRFQGEAGSMRIDVQAAQSVDSPRTSAIVPLAVIKALRNLTSTTFVGV
jgi:aspartate dehydrogenase